MSSPLPLPETDPGASESVLERSMRGARLAPEAYSGKRAATRDRLMDACAALIVRNGHRAVSMTAIAEEAGITRQTVYRYFANGDEVMRATLLRAGAEIQDVQRAVLQQAGEPGELLVEAVLVALRHVEGSALLRQVWSMAEFSQPMLRATLEPGFVRPGAESLGRIAGRLGWNPAETREAYEVLARTVLSLLVIRPPQPLSEAQLRAGLRRRFLPALGVQP